MSRNLLAPIVTRTVVADKGNSGSYCQRWSLEEHRTAPPTCEVDENQDIVAIDSCCGGTAPSPARSAICSSSIASSPTDPEIRLLARGGM